MAFHVRDLETDALVRKLAREKGVGITQAIKLAVDAELRRETSERPPLRERIRAIQDEVRSWPRTA